MRRARLALAALLLTCVVVPANAASIVITPEQPGSTEINDLSPFQRTGNFSEVFHNNLGVKMTDLKFTFFFPSGQPATDGDGLFDNSKTTFERAGSSLQFLTVTFQGGPGIPPCTHFRITTTGFDPSTVFTITPSVAIPEPSSVLLGAIGLAGVGLLGRCRRRAGGRVA